MRSIVRLVKPSVCRGRRLSDLLGALGDSKITVEQFWRHMAEAGLGDEDIDQYCAEHAGWRPDDSEGENT